MPRPRSRLPGRRVAFVGALADYDRLWGLHAAIKALHQGPVTFVRWLRARSELYDLAVGLMPKEPFILIKKGLPKVSFETYGGEPRPITKLTGKGLVHYARKLDVRPPGPVPPQGLLPGF